ncbi:hypothetical protein Fleli_1810 [Bernardetia litoralis DSM 6794]|uniref:Uncharacterized protein n=1 Tax=Bernardetia litoralis (strain ATCC 23117 / DSM 6794 / NBRC 15988 / NCIMB 1366 / Fx l1 / Sio-4) TaxID=880071 RepID=I4AJS3_BERLS|nr:hypothetical protein [Bernardetia litoralis]AFM04208.1 hypothetical protein Fleli_1810 [Bernardetia litoralis DSM 6794]
MQQSNNLLTQKLFKISDKVGYELIGFTFEMVDDKEIDIPLNNAEIVSIDEIRFIKENVKKVLLLKEICKILTIRQNLVPLWIKLKFEVEPDTTHLIISNIFREVDSIKKWYKTNKFAPFLMSPRYQG